MRRTMRTRHTAPIRLGLALPPELIVEVLEHLSAQELWTAASVSRQFYASAWRAGLAINRRIDWCLEARTISGDDAFQKLVVHALPKDLRIGLTLKYISHAEAEPPDAESHYKPVQPQLEHIFRLITAALPVIVSLSVELPDYSLPGLLGALCRPAPRLRSFEISHSIQDATNFSLPPNLFAHSAPLLRVLTVRSITLPDEPITAFRAVSSLHLEYDEVFPHIDVARYFPHLTGLRLDFFTAVGAACPGRFHLSGLALRSIIVYDPDSTGMADAVQRSIDLSAVPVVHVVGGEAIKWTDPSWTRDNDGLSIRLEQWPKDEEEICVAVVDEHLQWRRLYRLVRDIHHPLPIHNLPNVSTHLTYLRIDATFLRFFVALQLTLTALRDLHVDLRANGIDSDALAPPDYHGDVGIKSFLAKDAAPRAPQGPMYRAGSSCPVLEEITLFAVDATIAGVESRRVAFLARALGQLERPRGEKAAVALVGVAFARPVARTLLNQTVSKIRTYAFAGFGSCEDYDDGLWEDGV